MSTEPSPDRDVWHAVCHDCPDFERLGDFGDILDAGREHRDEHDHEVDAERVDAARRFHVKCSKVGCDFHVRAVGALAAEEAQLGHEDSTGHTVSVVADDEVEFTRASEQ